MSNALGHLAPKYAAPADWKVDKVKIASIGAIHRTGTYLATQEALDALVTAALAQGVALVYLDVPPMGFSEDERLSNPNAYYPTPALIAEQVANTREIAEIAAAAAEDLTGAVVASDEFIGAKIEEVGSVSHAAVAAFVTAHEAAPDPHPQYATGADLSGAVLAYKGTWNASTNSPALADGTGSTGDFYEVSVAGTRSLGSGNITFSIGDFISYDGAVWSRTPSPSTGPTSDEPNLKFVRGIVNTASGGFIVAGSGFSVTRHGTGDLTVTFDTPFASVPAVTFGSRGDGSALGPIVAHDDATARSNLSFRVEVVSIGAGFADGTFDFIACGPR